LNSIGGPYQGGGVTDCSANNSDDTVPIHTIASGLTGIDTPFAIAMDSTGKSTWRMHLAAPLTRQFLRLCCRQLCHSSPVVIVADNTGLEMPSGIALDSRDIVYVLNSNDWFTRYPAQSAGNVTHRFIINVDRWKQRSDPVAAGPFRRALSN
jgi:hypothetical protein